MMGSIGKIAGQISDAVVGRGDIGRILEQAVKEISTAQGSLGSAMQALSKSPGLVDKVAYIAILNGAIKKASQSASFNLETQINDLFVSLSVLRSRADARSQLQDLAEKRAEMMQMLTKIVNQYHQSAQNVTNQIR